MFRFVASIAGWFAASWKSIAVEVPVEKPAISHVLHRYGLPPI